MAKTAAKALASFEELAKERASIASRQLELDQQLAEFREMELARLTDEVSRFNETFNGTLELVPSSIARKPRKCGTCGETGHTAKWCGKPAQVPEKQTEEPATEVIP